MTHSPQLSLSTAYALHPTAAAREVAGEVFVVTDDRGLHRLELPTAVTVFRALMAGACKRTTLIERLVSEFEVEWEVAARDLDAFVATLIERRIAVACEAEPVAPPNNSREPAVVLGSGQVHAIAAANAAARRTK